ncbi:MOSC domain-containing protein [Negadavirga shengliensis]|uniref:MOSC domain-containing protein n=1 Tax=Negadavirga shengliensis TaxID=1389218 RepID=A0ABV9T577_9BACT
MKITHIYIYPIKSLGGISLSACKAEAAGFEYDRRWMLVDGSGRFLSQRSHHGMALLQSELTGDTLKVFHKQCQTLEFEFGLSQTSGKKLMVRIWDDTLEADLVSPDADGWFSEVLGFNARLVAFPKSGTTRKIGKKYRVDDGQVSFADSMPYLLIGQASLDDLNTRLEKKIGMDRFRPNLVFSSDMPFIEDDWSGLKIGEVTFRVSKPCARCVMTTIDQKTGKKGKEPLRSLSTYRKTHDKILFGQNLIAMDAGTVSVGDQLVST